MKNTMENPTQLRAYATIQLKAHYLILELIMFSGPNSRYVFINILEDRLISFDSFREKQAQGL